MKTILRSKLIFLLITVIALANPSYAQEVENVKLLKLNSEIDLAIRTNQALSMAAQAVFVNSGDTDNDGIQETPPFSTLPGYTPPAQGGFLPLSLHSLKVDGYGMPIGYCPFDNGATNTSSDRVTGTTIPDDNSVSFILISGGDNRVINTSCSEAQANNVQDDDISIVYTAGNSPSSIGYWREPVLNLTELNALPTSNIKTGEVRLVIETSEIYIWTETSPGVFEWSTQPSGGGGTKELRSISLGDGALLNSDPSATSNIAIGFDALNSEVLGSNNIAVGDRALINANGHGDNIAIGSNSLSSIGIMGGPLNFRTPAVAIGSDALSSLLHPGGNIGIGYQALMLKENGFNNVAIGARSSYKQTAGFLNVFIGHESARENTNSSLSVILGGYAAALATDISSSIAIGTYAAASTATITDVVAIGLSALRVNTAPGTVAIGNYSLENYSLGVAGNMAIGHESLRANTGGLSNTAIGYRTLSALTTGSNNIAIGKDTMRNAVSGGNNVAVGVGVLENNTGNDNSALGTFALRQNTTGYSNTALGTSALFFNTSGNRNTNVGFESGMYTSTGYSNVSVGNKALRRNTTGRENIAIGESALELSQFANLNTAVGAYSLRTTTFGGNNSALGHSALANNTSGSNNVAVGNDALINNNTGASNVGVGRGALYALQSGITNVGVGTYAGASLTTDRDNVMVGHHAGRYITNASGDVVIGAEAAMNTVSTSGSVILGYRGLNNASTTDHTVSIGHNINQNSASSNITDSFGSVYIGSGVRPLAASSANEIIIGYGAIGNGSNTVTLGNASTTTVHSYGSYNQLSDIRHKTDIEKIDNALAKVNAINGMYYKWKDKSSDTSRQIGFIAQELELVIPEVVSVGADKERTKMVSYGPVVALTIEAIKELDGKVDNIINQHISEYDKSLFNISHKGDERIIQIDNNMLAELYNQNHKGKLRNTDLHALTTAILVEEVADHEKRISAIENKIGLASNTNIEPKNNKTIALPENSPNSESKEPTWDEFYKN